MASFNDAPEALLDGVDYREDAKGAKARKVNRDDATSATVGGDPQRVAALYREHLSS